MSGSQDCALCRADRSRQIGGDLDDVPGKTYQLNEPHEPNARRASSSTQHRCRYPVLGAPHMRRAADSSTSLHGRTARPVSRELPISVALPQHSERSALADPVQHPLGRGRKAQRAALHSARHAHMTQRACEACLDCARRAHESQNNMRTTAM